MPFKHYIRSIEGKTEVIVDKPFHPKPVWFNETHAQRIFNPSYRCVHWFTWTYTPQGHSFWNKVGSRKYDELPPEYKEIIDSWVAQVNGGM